MLPKFLCGASVVPAVSVNVIDSCIDFAFVGPHVVKLINDGTFKDPVLCPVGLNHGGELVDFGDISASEAVLVEDNGVIHIHTSFDTGQEMVTHIEVPLDISHIYEVWNVSPLMLEGFFLGIEALPELRIIGHS